MTTNKAHRFLDDIIKKFPYSGRSNQLDILVDFFTLNAGKPPKDIKEQLNIHYKTQRKIRDAWNNLTEEERGYLLIQVGTQLLKNQNTEDQHSNK